MVIVTNYNATFTSSTGAVWNHIKLTMGYNVFLTINYQDSILCELWINIKV